MSFSVPTVAEKDVYNYQMVIYKPFDGGAASAFVGVLPRNTPKGSAAGVVNPSILHNLVNPVNPVKKENGRSFR